MPALAFEAWLSEDDPKVRDDVDEFDILIFALEPALQVAEPFASLELFEAFRL